MTSPYSSRKYTFIMLLIITLIIFLGKIFYIQIIDDYYKIWAISNTQRKLTIYPPRGLIIDRHGKIMVSNVPAYDLMFIPYQSSEFDTVELSKILEIDVTNLKKIIEKAKKNSRYQPYPVASQISINIAAALKEKLYKYKGFYLQGRTIRHYTLPAGGHLLGYISEVDKKFLKNNPSYKMGDLVGITGLEKTYEQYLKGQKGASIVLVDVHNRIVGKFADGKYDTIAIPGKNIITGIDWELQYYGEQLMKNKRGSIVAIEPSTGEILILVSSPSYDPSLLTGFSKNKNFKKLVNDPQKPLFNRALMAQYPPGSTFKMVNALIGLNENILKPGTSYGCSKGVTVGPIHVGCHPHPSPLQMEEAIQYSCNSYFTQAFLHILGNKKYKNTEEAFKVWRNYVTAFGFGTILGSDLAYELKGIVPTVQYYDKYFGKHRWKPLTIVSLGIGQGELSLTPLQLANYACILANRGFYYTPHVVREINDKNFNNSKYKIKHVVPINKSYFEIICNAMQKVVESGTARIAKIDSIVVCGKTGTAQNPHGKDHSLFIAFAPKDNPKIAICVVVENAGFGATYAAPIASLIIEKYLKRKVKRKELEKRMLEADLINNNDTLNNDKEHQ
ncbi:MAG: penicillin-binding protein 2 [Bacteroidales bacterium]|nr:penicillin-binding protein 2 [Bacteroidales bacterium]